MPKGITRIENYKRRADGWLVRLQSRGERYSEFFKDSDYGGESAALRAARRCYRRMLIEHPKLTRQENAERETVRTGDIIGVRKLLKPRFGHVYEVWEARWSPKKYQRRVRTFSVEKYGENEAKRLAVEARLQGLGEMSRR